MRQHTPPTPRGLFSGITWPLVLGLGSLALTRPLLRVTGVGDALALGPFLTLVHTGVAYGVFAIALSAILSPVIDGRLQGPITNPFALVTMLLLNAVWGAMAGGIALGIQGLTGDGGATR